MIKRASLATGLILALAVVAAAQVHETVYISAFPGERMEDGGVFFGPDPTPYYPGVRGRAGLWLDWTKGGAGKMPDGQVVVGFDFYAWQEADIATVVVLAKIAKDGLPATPRTQEVDVKDGTGAVRRVTTTLPPDNVQSVEFTRYTLRRGETKTIDEMKTLGLKPITLKGGGRDDIDAQPARR